MKKYCVVHTRRIYDEVNFIKCYGIYNLVLAEKIRNNISGLIVNTGGCSGNYVDVVEYCEDEEYQ